MTMKIDEELMNETYIIRYKIVRGILKGTDVSSWYLEALANKLDYISKNGEKESGKAVARNALVNVNEKLKRANEGLLCGNEISAVWMDSIIFALLNGESI